MPSPFDTARSEAPLFFGANELGKATDRFLDEADPRSVRGTFYSAPKFEIPLDKIDEAVLNFGSMSGAGRASSRDSMLDFDQALREAGAGVSRYSRFESSERIHSKVYTREVEGQREAFISTANLSEALKQKLGSPGQRRMQGVQARERQTNVGVVTQDPAIVRGIDSFITQASAGLRPISTGPVLSGADASNAVMRELRQAKKGDEVVIAAAFMDHAMIVDATVQAKRQGAKVTVVSNKAAGSRSEEEDLGGNSRLMGRAQATLSKEGIDVYTPKQDDPLMYHTKGVTVINNRHGTGVTFIGSHNLTRPAHQGESVDLLVEMHDFNLAKQFRREVQSHIGSQVAKPNYLKSFQAYNDIELRMARYGLEENYALPTRSSIPTQLGSRRVSPDGTSTSPTELMPYYPTKMEGQFFKEFRGTDIPEIQMYQRLYEARTGKQATKAIKQMDKELSAPGWGEKFNRLVGLNLYEEGQGVVLSSARAVGRILDWTFGAETYNKREQARRGAWDGTARKYAATQYRSDADFVGPFEHSFQVAAEFAQGTAIAVGFYLGINLPTQHIAGSIMDAWGDYLLEMPKASGVRHKGLKGMTQSVLEGIRPISRNLTFGGFYGSVFNKVLSDPNLHPEDMVSEVLKEVQARRPSAGIEYDSRTGNARYISLEREGLVGLSSMGRRYSRSIFQHAIRPVLEAMAPYDMTPMDTGVLTPGARYTKALDDLDELLSRPPAIEIVDSSTGQVASKLKLVNMGRDLVIDYARAYDKIGALLPMNLAYWIPGLRDLLKLPEFDPKQNLTIRDVMSFEVGARWAETFTRSAGELIRHPQRSFNQIRDLWQSERSIRTLERNLSNSLRQVGESVALGTPTTQQGRFQYEVQARDALQQRLDIVFKGQGSTGAEWVKYQEELQAHRSLIHKAKEQKVLMEGPTDIKHPFKEGWQKKGAAAARVSRARELLIVTGAVLITDKILDKFLLSTQGATLETQVAARKDLETEGGTAARFTFTGTQDKLAVFGAAAIAGTAAGLAFPVIQDFDVSLTPYRTAQAAAARIGNFYGPNASFRSASYLQSTAATQNQINELAQATARNETLIQGLQKTPARSQSVRFNYKAAGAAALVATIAVRAYGSLSAAIANWRYEGDPFGKESVQLDSGKAVVSAIAESLVVKARDSKTEYDAQDEVNLALGSMLARESLIGRSFRGRTYNTATQFTTPFVQIAMVARADSRTGDVSFGVGFQLMPTLGLGISPTLPVGVRLNRQRSEEEMAIRAGAPITELSFTDHIALGSRGLFGLMTFGHGLAYMPSTSYEKSFEFLGTAVLAGAVFGGIKNSRLAQAAKPAWLQRELDFLKPTTKLAGQTFDLVTQTVAWQASLPFVTGNTLTKGVSAAFSDVPSRVEQALALDPFAPLPPGMTRPGPGGRYDRLKNAAAVGIGAPFKLGQYTKDWIGQNPYMRRIVTPLKSVKIGNVGRRVAPYYVALTMARLMSEYFTQNEQVAGAVGDDFADPRPQYEAALGVGLLTGFVLDKAGVFASADQINDFLSGQKGARKLWAFGLGRPFLQKIGAHPLQDAAIAVHSVDQPKIVRPIAAPFKNVGARVALAAGLVMGIRYTAAFIAHSMENKSLRDFYNVPILGPMLRMMSGVEPEADRLLGIRPDGFKDSVRRGGMVGFLSHISRNLFAGRDLPAMIGMYRDTPDPFMGWLGGQFGQSFKESGPKNYLQFSTTATDISASAFDMIQKDLSTDDMMTHLRILQSGAPSSLEQLLAIQRGAPTRESAATAHAFTPYEIAAAQRSSGLSRALRLRQFNLINLTWQRPSEHLYDFFSHGLKLGMAGHNAMPSGRLSSIYNPYSSMATGGEIEIYRDMFTTVEDPEIATVRRIMLRSQYGRNTFIQGFNPFKAGKELASIPYIGGSLGTAATLGIFTAALSGLAFSIGALAYKSTISEYEQLFSSSRLIQGKPITNAKKFEFLISGELGDLKLEQRFVGSATQVQYPTGVDVEMLLNDSGQTGPRMTNRQMEKALRNSYVRTFGSLNKYLLKDYSSLVGDLVSGSSPLEAADIQAFKSQAAQKLKKTLKTSLSSTVRGTSRTTFEVFYGSNLPNSITLDEYLDHLVDGLFNKTLDDVVSVRQKLTPGLTKQQRLWQVLAATESSQGLNELIDILERPMPGIVPDEVIKTQNKKHTEQAKRAAAKIANRPYSEGVLRTGVRSLGAAGQLLSTYMAKIMPVYEALEGLAVRYDKNQTAYARRVASQHMVKGTLDTAVALGVSSLTTKGLIALGVLNPLALAGAGILALIGLHAFKGTKPGAFVRNTEDAIVQTLTNLVDRPVETVASALDPIKLGHPVRVLGKPIATLVSGVMGVATEPLRMITNNITGPFLAKLHFDLPEKSGGMQLVLGQLMPRSVYASLLNYHAGEMTWHGRRPWAYGNPKAMYAEEQVANIINATSVDKRVDPVIAHGEVFGRPSGAAQQILYSRYFTSYAGGGRILQPFRLDSQYVSSRLRMELERRQFMYDLMITGAPLKNPYVDSPGQEKYKLATFGQGSVVTNIVTWGGTLTAYHLFRSRRDPIYYGQRRLPPGGGNIPGGGSPTPPRPPGGGSGSGGGTNIGTRPPTDLGEGGVGSVSTGPRTPGGASKGKGPHSLLVRPVERLHQWMSTTLDFDSPSWWRKANASALRARRHFEQFWFRNSIDILDADTIPDSSVMQTLTKLVTKSSLEAERYRTRHRLLNPILRVVFRGLSLIKPESQGLRPLTELRHYLSGTGIPVTPQAKTRRSLIVTTAYSLMARSNNADFDLSNLSTEGTTFLGTAFSVPIKTKLGAFDPKLKDEFTHAIKLGYNSWGGFSIEYDKDLHVFRAGDVYDWTRTKSSTVTGSLNAKVVKAMRLGTVIFPSLITETTSKGVESFKPRTFRDYYTNLKTAIKDIWNSDIEADTKSLETSTFSLDNRKIKGLSEPGLVGYTHATHKALRGLVGVYVKHLFWRAVGGKPFVQYIEAPASEIQQIINVISDESYKGERLSESVAKWVVNYIDTGEGLETGIEGQEMSDAKKAASSLKKIPKVLNPLNILSVVSDVLTLKSIFKTSIGDAAGAIYSRNSWHQALHLNREKAGLLQGALLSMAAAGLGKGGGTAIGGFAAGFVMSQLGIDLTFGLAEGIAQRQADMAYSYGVSRSGLPAVMLSRLNAPFITEQIYKTSLEGKPNILMAPKPPAHWNKFVRRAGGLANAAYRVGEFVGLTAEGAALVGTLTRLSDYGDSHPNSRRDVGGAAMSRALSFATQLGFVLAAPKSIPSMLFGLGGSLVVEEIGWRRGQYMADGGASDADYWVEAAAAINFSFQAPMLTARLKEVTSIDNFYTWLSNTGQAETFGRKMRRTDAFLRAARSFKPNLKTLMSSAWNKFKPPIQKLASDLITKGRTQATVFRQGFQKVLARSSEVAKTLFHLAETTDNKIIKGIRDPLIQAFRYLDLKTKQGVAALPQLGSLARAFYGSGMSTLKQTLANMQGGLAVFAREFRKPEFWKHAYSDLRRVTQEAIQRYSPRIRALVEPMLSKGTRWMEKMPAVAADLIKRAAPYAKAVGRGLIQVGGAALVLANMAVTTAAPYVRLGAGKAADLIDFVRRPVDVVAGKLVSTMVTGLGRLTSLSVARIAQSRGFKILSATQLGQRAGSFLSRVMPSTWLEAWKQSASQAIPVGQSLGRFDYLTKRVAPLLDNASKLVNIISTKIETRFAPQIASLEAYRTVAFNRLRPHIQAVRSVLQAGMNDPKSLLQKLKTKSTSMIRMGQNLFVNSRAYKQTFRTVARIKSIGKKVAIALGGGALVGLGASVFGLDLLAKAVGPKLKALGRFTKKAALPVLGVASDIADAGIGGYHLFSGLTQSSRLGPDASREEYQYSHEKLGMGTGRLSGLVGGTLLGAKVMGAGASLFTAGLASTTTGVGAVPGIATMILGGVVFLGGVAISAKAPEVLARVGGAIGKRFGGARHHVLTSEFDQSALRLSSVGGYREGPSFVAPEFMSDTRTTSAMAYGATGLATGGAAYSVLRTAGALSPRVATRAGELLGRLPGAQRLSRLASARRLLRGAQVLGDVAVAASVVETSISSIQATTAKSSTVRAQAARRSATGQLSGIQAGLGATAVALAGGGIVSQLFALSAGFLLPAIGVDVTFGLGAGYAERQAYLAEQYGIAGGGISSAAIMKLNNPALLRGVPTGAFGRGMGYVFRAGEYAALGVSLFNNIQNLSKLNMSGPDAELTTSAIMGHQASTAAAIATTIGTGINPLGIALAITAPLLATIYGERRGAFLARAGATEQDVQFEAMVGHFDALKTGAKLRQSGALMGTQMVTPLMSRFRPRRARLQGFLSGIRKGLSNLTESFAQKSRDLLRGPSEFGQELMTKFSLRTAAAPDLGLTSPARPARPARPALFPRTRQFFGDAAGWAGRKLLGFGHGVLDVTAGLTTGFVAGMPEGFLHGLRGRGIKTPMINPQGADLRASRRAGAAIGRGLGYLPGGILNLAGTALGELGGMLPAGLLTGLTRSFTAGVTRQEMFSPVAGRRGFFFRAGEVAGDMVGYSSGWLSNVATDAVFSHARSLTIGLTEGTVAGIRGLGLRDFRAGRGVSLPGTVNRALPQASRNLARAVGYLPSLTLHGALTVLGELGGMLPGGFAYGMGEGLRGGITAATNMGTTRKAPIFARGLQSNSIFFKSGQALGRGLGFIPGAALGLPTKHVIIPGALSLARSAGAFSLGLAEGALNGIRGVGLEGIGSLDMLPWQHQGLSRAVRNLGQGASLIPGLMLGHAVDLAGELFGMAPAGLLTGIAEGTAVGYRDSYLSLNVTGAHFAKPLTSAQQTRLQKGKYLEPLMPVGQSRIRSPLFAASRYLGRGIGRVAGGLGGLGMSIAEEMAKNVGFFGLGLGEGVVHGITGGGRKHELFKASIEARGIKRGSRFLGQALGFVPSMAAHGLVSMAGELGGMLPAGIIQGFAEQAIYSHRASYARAGMPVFTGKAGQQVLNRIPSPTKLKDARVQSFFHKTGRVVGRVPGQIAGFLSGTATSFLGEVLKDAASFVGGVGEGAATGITGRGLREGMLTLPVQSTGLAKVSRIAGRVTGYLPSLAAHAAISLTSELGGMLPGGIAYGMGEGVSAGFRGAELLKPLYNREEVFFSGGQILGRGLGFVGGKILRLGRSIDKFLGSFLGNLTGGAITGAAEGLVSGLAGNLHTLRVPGQSKSRVFQASRMLGGILPQLAGLTAFAATRMAEFAGVLTTGLTLGTLEGIGLGVMSPNKPLNTELLSKLLAGPAGGNTFRAGRSLGRTMGFVPSALASAAMTIANETVGSIPAGLAIGAGSGVRQGLGGQGLSRLTSRPGFKPKSRALRGATNIGESLTYYPSRVARFIGDHTPGALKKVNHSGAWMFDQLAGLGIGLPSGLSFGLGEGLSEGLFRPLSSRAPLFERALDVKPNGYFQFGRHVGRAVGYVPALLVRAGAEIMNDSIGLIGRGLKKAYDYTLTANAVVSTAMSDAAKPVVEGTKNFVSPIWDFLNRNIPETGIGRGLKKFARGASNFLSTTAQGIGAKVSNLRAGTGAFLRSAATMVGDTASSSWSMLRDFISSTGEGIAEKIQGLLPKPREAKKGQGLWSSVMERAGAFKRGMTDFLNTELRLDGLAEFAFGTDAKHLNWKTPSFKGLWQGTLKLKSKIGRVLTEMAQGTYKALSWAATKVYDPIEGAIIGSSRFIDHRILGPTGRTVMTQLGRLGGPGQRIASRLDQFHSAIRAKSRAFLNTRFAGAGRFGRGLAALGIVGDVIDIGTGIYDIHKGTQQISALSSYSSLEEHQYAHQRQWQGAGRIAGVGLGVKLGAPLMASGAGMIKTGLAGAVAGAPTGVGALPGLAVAGTGLLTFLAGGALMVGGPIVGDLLGKGIGTIGGSMNYWNRRNAEARPEWAKSRNSRGRARNRSRRAYLERRQQRQDEREEKKRLQLERTPTEATSAREPSMSRRSWFDRPANRPSLRQRRLEGRLQPQFVASAMIADDMGMMALDFEQKIDIETSKKNATSYFSLIPQKSNQEKLEEYIDSVQDADQHEEKSEGFLQWLSRAFGWLWDKSSSFAPSILAAANPVFGAGFSIYNAGRQFIQGRNGVRQEYQQFVQGLGRGATAIGNTIRGIPGRMFPGLSTPNTEAEIPKSPGLIITEILSGGAFTGSTGIVGSLRGSPIAESQVSGNYRAVTLPGMGEVIITGGYMEPHGHAPKGSLKAIFSSDPNQIVNLPPSGRNIGIDLVPTEGQVARAILPGTVESIDWSQGMGPVVVKRTDRTFKYKGKEFPVFIEYEHLGQNTVKPGDRVKVGQIVGRGWDGGGTGFHYGVDPYIYVPGEGQVRVAPNLIFGEQATKKDTTPIIPAKTKVEYGKGQTIKSGRSATLSDAEFYTLAATSLLEAIPIGSGGGKQAVADVAHTVMARVHSTRHENDVISVAFSPSQFEVADGYNRSSFTTREGVIKALMTDRSYSRKAAEQAIQTFESVMADGDYLKNSVDSLQGRLNFQVGSYSWGGAIINRHGHNFSNPDPAVKDKVPFIIKRGPQTNLFGGTTFKKEGEVSITYNLGALVESVNQSLSERQDKFRFNVNQALEPDRFIKELQGLYLAGKLNQEQLNLLRADIMTHNRLTAKGFVLQYPDYDTTMKAMSGSFNPDDVKSRINNVTSLLARSNNTIAMAEGILGDDPGTKFAENQARQYPHKYKGAVYVPNAPSFLAQVDPNLNLKMREYAKAIVSQDSLLLTTPEVWDQMVASKHDRRPSLRNTKPDPSSIDTVGYYVYGDATLKVRQGANVDPEMIASMSLEILERRLEYQIFQTQGRTPTSVNHLNTLVGDHLSREQKLENVYQHLIKFGDDPGKFATNQIRPWLTNSRDPAIKAALKEVENLESAAGDPKTKTLGNVAEQLRLHRKSGLLPRRYPTPEGPGQVEIGTLTQEDLAKRHHEAFEAVRSLPLDDPRRKAANYLPKEIYLVRPPEQTRIGTDSKRAGLNPQLSAELYAEMERLAPSFGLKVVLSSPTQSYKESLKEARARELERSAYALMISFNRGGVFTPGVGTVDPKFGGSINVLDLYLHQGALDLGSLSQYDKFINSKGEWERHHNISRASEMGVSHLELGQLRRMLASEVEGNGVVDRRELRRLASHLLVSIGAAAGHGSLQFTPGRTQQGGLTMRVAQRTSNFVQAGARAGSSGGPSGRGYRTPAQVPQSQRPVYRAPIGPTRPGQSYLAPIGPTRPGQSHLPPIGPQPRGSGGSSQGATWSTPRSPSRPTPARGSTGTRDRNIFQRGGDWIRRRIPGLNRRSSALEDNVYAFAGSEFDPSTRNLESSIQATEQIAMREASPTYRESVDPSLAEPRFDIANDLRTGSLESAVGSAYISESETERTRAVQVFLSQASAAIDSVEAKTKQQEPKAVQIQTHKTALASTDRYEKALRPTRSSEPVAVVIENPNGNKEVYVDLNNPLPSHVTGVPDMQDYASNDTYLSSYSYS